MAYKDFKYSQSAESKEKDEILKQNSTYTQNKYFDVTGAQERYDAIRDNPIADWTGGTYGEDIKTTMDKINNREKFTYDLNADMLYQQYKDQYMNLGQLAMQDTMGQAAAMTGGYGNSYAATAGNQAYQGYLQQLNNVVPELYQLALDKYNQEGQDLKDMYSMYNQQYENEYAQYRDSVADYYADLQNAQNEYYTNAELDRSWWQSDYDRYYTDAKDTREWDYNTQSDTWEKGYSNYQQQVAEQQYAQELALQQAQFEKELALQQAQLNETIRANKADEAYKNAVLKAEQEAAKTKTHGSSGGSFDTSTTSKNITEFKKNIATEKQYEASANSYNSLTVYGSYENYLQQQIIAAKKQGKLTEDEALALYDEYFG